MSRPNTRAHTIACDDSGVKSPDATSFGELDLHWKNSLAEGVYDFLDFGCSKGGSSSVLAEKLGLKSGLAIDPDKRRVAASRSAGAGAVCADLIRLHTPPAVVEAVIASNFLSRLPGPEAVRQVMAAALHAARDYVLIRQPFFDANPRLLALGLELHSASRPGFANLMTSDDVWRAVRPQLEGGSADLYVFGRKRIVSSSHPSIVPLSGSDAAGSSKDGGTPSMPPIKFGFPVFAELVAIVVKRGPSGPNADWEAIAKQLGCDRLLVKIGGGQHATVAPKTKPTTPTPVAGDHSAYVAPSAEKGVRNYLFVCGVARSGTTVLTEILNAHPKVSLGVERYKNLSNKGDEDFGPQLFEKERFFDFRADDTNVSMPKVYEMLRGKYNKSLYVGDKVPRYYRKIGKILATFSPVKVVFISRDISAVSFSWNERADNPKDSWPAENDFSKAVVEWNLGNKIALAAARRDPERVAVVNYDAIVKEGFAPTERLMSWLGLEVDEEFRRAYQRIMTKAPTKKIKTPKPGQEAFIAKQADFETYKALRALAL